jgi:hypothetical protein
MTPDSTATISEGRRAEYGPWAISAHPKWPVRPRNPHITVALYKSFLLRALHRRSSVRPPIHGGPLAAIISLLPFFAEGAGS